MLEGYREVVVRIRVAGLWEDRPVAASVLEVDTELQPVGARKQEDRRHQVGGRLEHDLLYDVNSNSYVSIIILH